MVTILFIGIIILPSINSDSIDVDTLNKKFDQDIEKIGFRNSFPVNSKLHYEDKIIEWSSLDADDYTPHDPIHIEGNSDFAIQAEREGWSGEGTIDNPYIIENYAIDASETYGIDIRNADVYFMIRNCVIYDGIYSIYLEDVKNGRIIGVKSSSIILHCSSNNIISNNNISNGLEGVSLHDSSNNIIFENTIYDNDYGVYLQDSSNNIIDGNRIINSQFTGIRINSSSGTIITGNNITLGSMSIKIESSVYTVITGNRFTNTHSGIWVYSSSDIAIAGNTIDTDVYGISLDDSSKITISRNNFIGIDTEGIIVEDSLDNIIIDNVFQSDGIVILGCKIEYWNSHVIENNTVNGKPIRYYKNVNDIVVPNTTSQVILANCRNCIIQNLNLLHISIGVQLGFSSGNTISGNNIMNNRLGGIHLYSSSNNVIEKNKIISNDWFGIYLDHYSNCNTIEKNNFIDSGFYHAHFDNSFLNRWLGNYWDDWHSILPRPIHGEMKIRHTTNWLNFDWYPAKEPYDT